MSKNLVKFDNITNINKYKYIEYWKSNIDTIYQRKTNDMEKYLKFLVNKKVIIYNKEAKNNMKNVFYNTKRKTINICPGFVMIFYISSETAIEKDKDGKLEILISEKIKDGLSIVDLKWEKILK